MRVLLMGGGDLAEEVARRSRRAARTSTGSSSPTTSACARRSRTSAPDVVCVAAREDAFPLRMALLVRHYDDDVPLVVTIFDPAMARQVARDDPALHGDLGGRHRRADRSPGRVLTRTSSSIRRDGERLVGLDALARGGRAAGPARRAGCAACAEAVFAPYDRSAALLFYGAIGLVAMLAVRVGRVDDRARPGRRRRALRLDQVARHGRPEPGGGRRAEVVQGRDRRLDGADAALGRVLHRRADQPRSSTRA